MGSKRYASRFREATNALSKHPKRVELGIPGAQGQSELESIQALEPNTVVQYLNQVTGIENLKQRCILLLCPECVLQLHNTHILFFPGRVHNVMHTE